MKYTYEQLVTKKDLRKSGYVDAVLAASTNMGENTYEINDTVLDKIRKEYALLEQVNGLGDLVGLVATPIAKGLKMSCIDPETQKLRPDSPCARRKKFLNSLISFKKQDHT